MVKLYMTSVAALAELAVSDGELLSILLLDRAIKRIKRRFDSDIDQFGDRHSGKTRLRLDNTCKRLSKLGNRIGGERPVLHLSGETKLRVAGLDNMFIMSPMVIT